MRNSRLSSRPQLQSYNVVKNCQPLLPGQISVLELINTQCCSTLSCWSTLCNRGWERNVTDASVRILLVPRPLLTSILDSGPSPMHSFGRHWIVSIREHWKCSQVQLAYFPPSQWAWTNGSVQSASEEINTFPLVPELHNEPDSIASSCLTLPCNLCKKNVYDDSLKVLSHGAKTPSMFTLPRALAETTFSSVLPSPRHVCFESLP